MADPLDALRLPDRPVTPDPAFARALRARLEAALAPEVTLRGGDPVPPTTTTATTLTPYLAVSDAAAALAWYAEVLGAVETMRVPMDDGRIGHAEVDIGGAHLALADEFPEVGHHGPLHHGGTAVTLLLDGVDVDATFARAVAAGATAERPPADQPHGNRNAVVVDPWGHRWMLSRSLA